MVLAAYKHIFIISAILKEVFCKDTNLLRKGKARACESLGFVVNKNVFKDFVSVKRKKIKKGASQTYDTPSSLELFSLIRFRV